jgi:2-phospho-L-lactate guanylyltransferase
LRIENAELLNSQFSILNSISLHRIIMIAAIVPVKALALAKGRLSALLSAPERRALVLAMLDDVLAALKATHGVSAIGVISADPAVLALAADRGADALPDRAADLNTALAQAAGHYAAAGATAILALPADVPLVSPTEIEQLIAARSTKRGMIITPSHDGGTNALLIWPPMALPFLFGKGSLARHLEAARERGLETQLLRSPGLELDIDRPDDLLLVARTAGDTAAQRLARELGVCDRVMHRALTR